MAENERKRTANGKENATAQNEFARMLRDELEWDENLNIETINSLVANLNTPLLTYPQTVKYLGAHKEQFEKQRANALDEKYLIAAELERFETYIKPDKLKANYESSFIARGFKWALTGETYTIKDFFDFKGDTRPDLYSILTTEYGREQWSHVVSYIDRAALGYSYALYVQYLKSLDAKETTNTPATDTPNTNKNEPGKLIQDLPAWAKVLMLHKTGYFDEFERMGYTGKMLAPIVSHIIGNGMNVDNIGNYITTRFGLEKKYNVGRTKKIVEKVNALITTLKTG